MWQLRVGRVICFNSTVHVFISIFFLCSCFCLYFQVVVNGIQTDIPLASHGVCVFVSAHVPCVEFLITAVVYDLCVLYTFCLFIAHLLTPIGKSHAAQRRWHFPPVVFFFSWGNEWVRDYWGVQMVKHFACAGAICTCYKQAASCNLSL